MALSRASAMFKLYPSKTVYKQKVKLRPNEHHYENEGEEPYIKYSCQLCEQLAENIKDMPLYADDEDDEGGKFTRFSLPKGIEQCPCCGINVDWNYIRSEEYMRKYDTEKVKEYLEQFDNNYSIEFHIALLIFDRLDLGVEDVTDNIVNRVGDIVDDIYNHSDSIYNEVLNNELNHLEEELNDY